MAGVGLCIVFVVYMVHVDSVRWGRVSECCSAALMVFMVFACL